MRETVPGAGVLTPCTTMRANSAADAAHVHALVRRRPVDHVVAHAEDGQHCQPHVEVGAHAAVCDAGADHLGKAALDAAAAAPDAAARRLRQVAPLVDEDLDVVALDLVGRQVRRDQARELVDRRRIRRRRSPRRSP